MSDIKLRTESLKDDEILNLAVSNKNDKKILSSLLSSEPCLLEGSRGTGKSFLMKLAEINLNKNKKVLPVFISFNVSSLINTNDSLQFYHWMLGKSIRALMNKLRKQGITLSTYSKNLLSNDTSENSENIEKNLRSMVKAFESSYSQKDVNIDTEALPDIEDVKEAIKEICEENNLDRIYFFFDEAAHVFRPEQQRQFFNLYKDLRSPYVTCNAAIYPGVTHFGSSFEPTHDCIYEILDRNISDIGYLSYFEEMLFKQIESDKKLKDSITKRRDLFNTLALCCGGNPRILLKTIQELSSFNVQQVNIVIKDFYRMKIWREHTELGEKYEGHKKLIDWGRDFLETTVIETIQENEKSTIYFWIDKDIPQTVKEALRLLTYTGIIKKVDSGMKSHGRIGIRYEIKYGCMIALEDNPHSASAKFFDKKSLRQFTAFGKQHPAYEDIQYTDTLILDGAKYQQSLESMLQKSIEVLSLTTWQKNKLLEANINTIKDLHNLKEKDLIEQIYNVGTVRARYIMNAANSEILEYISG